MELLEESKTSELHECKGCKLISGRTTVYTDIRNGKIVDIYVWCEMCDYESEW